MTGCRGLLGNVGIKTYEWAPPATGGLFPPSWVVIGLQHFHCLGKGDLLFRGKIKRAID